MGALQKMDKSLVAKMETKSIRRIDEDSKKTILRIKRIDHLAETEDVLEDW